MDKINVAIWGITESIWASIKSNLDFRKISISFFIDNNEFTNGLIYEGIDIYNYGEEIKKKINDIDYIMIAAYSGYQNIFRQLEQDGIEKNKIQLYITTELLSYYVGRIHNVNFKLIDLIYYSPLKIKNVLIQYRKITEMYMESVPIVEDKERWYEQSRFVAHACGGFVDGEKILYTNSKEALENTLNNQHYKLIECDVCGKEREELILAHDYLKVTEGEQKKYTIQSLEMAINRIISFPKVRLLIDVKWDYIDDFDYYLEKVTSIVEARSTKEKEQLKKQIVMEVYDESSIISTKKKGFDCFYTQYRNPKRNSYMEIALTCIQYNIGAVGFSVDYINNNEMLIPIFHEKNIKIFGYSCDSLTEYRLLRHKGIDGIFTNFLIPN